MTLLSHMVILIFPLDLFCYFLSNSGRILPFSVTKWHCDGEYSRVRQGFGCL